MKNKYKGECIFCNKTVDKKQGVCWYNEKLGWIIGCLDCIKGHKNLNEKFKNTKRRNETWILICLQK